MKPQHSSLIFVLLLGLLIPIIAMSGEWTWQNPLPQGNAINAFQFIDNGCGWTVGDIGSIQYTNDGGGTWETQQSGTSWPLTSISFIDKKNGWVAGKFIILHTSDGGETWHTQFPCSIPEKETDQVYRKGSDNSLPIVHFVNLKSGWAVIEHSLMKTEDGGLHWQITNLLPNASFNIQFLDAETALLLTPTDNFDTNAVLRTTDGGKHWLAVEDLQKKRCCCLTILGSKKGWITTSSGIRITNDGGLHWSPFVSGTSKDKTQKKQYWPIGPYSYMYFFDKKHGWLNSQNGLFSTSDGGANWRYLSDQIQNATAIQFADSLHGWLLNENKLKRTINGGKSWESARRFILDRFENVCSIDSIHVWVVGENNSVLKTNDGGNKWAQYHVSQNSRFTNVQFIDTLNGWVLNDSNIVFHTTDGGNQWTMQNPLTDLDSWWYRHIAYMNFITMGYDSRSEMKFFDSKNGWLKISRWKKIRKRWWNLNYLFFREISREIVYELLQKTGLAKYFSIFPYYNHDVKYILHTSDGGLTWKRSECEHDNGFNSVYFSDSIHATYVNVRWRWSTSNGGLSWEKKGINNDRIPFGYRVTYFNRKYGAVPGNKSIYLTTNGGVDWIEKGIPSKFYTADLAYTTKNDIWCLDQRNRMFHSTDRGETWSSHLLPTTQALYSIAFSDSTHGWAVGEMGTILHYGNGSQ